jgi:hypothetical protein
MIERISFFDIARSARASRSGLLAVAAVFTAAMSLAGCTSSAFLHTSLAEPACLRHARQVLYDSDFTENLVVAPTSVSGRHGGYDAIITCTDHIVNLDVHGLDPYQIAVYRASITGKF